MDLDPDDDDAFHLQKKGENIADDRKAINKELDQVKIMSYVFIFTDFRELVFLAFFLIRNSVKDKRRISRLF